MSDTSGYAGWFTLFRALQTERDTRGLTIDLLPCCRGIVRWRGPSLKARRESREISPGRLCLRLDVPPCVRWPPPDHCCSLPCPEFPSTNGAGPGDTRYCQCDIKRSRDGLPEYPHEGRCNCG